MTECNYLFCISSEWSWSTRRWTDRPSSASTSASACCSSGRIPSTGPSHICNSLQERRDARRVRISTQTGSEDKRNKTKTTRKQNVNTQTKRGEELLSTERERAKKTNAKRDEHARAHAHLAKGETHF